jgi:hypothetical protein
LFGLRGLSIWLPLQALQTLTPTRRSAVKKKMILSLQQLPTNQKPDECLRDSTSSLTGCTGA